MEFEHVFEVECKKVISVKAICWELQFLNFMKSSNNLRVMGYHQGVFKLSGKVILSSQHVLQLGKYYISLDPNSERNSLLTSISFSGNSQLLRYREPPMPLLKHSMQEFAHSSHGRNYSSTKQCQFP